jgi:hypothetical protein
LLLILNPVVLIAIGGIDHFGNDLVICLQDQNSPSIFVLSAIVSSRKDGDECSSSKSFESIHHALMSTNDHVEIVLGEEAFYAIWPKFNDITRF